MKTEYKIIADIIENNSSILDVGCDDGTLMEFLKNKPISIISILNKFQDSTKNELWNSPEEIIHNYGKDEEIPRRS